MDNFCAMALRILDWIDHTDVPPMPFIGQASGRVYNPPAPQISIALATQGNWKPLRVGNRPHEIPEGHVSIHSVHFGNFGRAPKYPRLAWCLFLDLSGVRGFEELHKSPFASAVQVTQIDRLIDAYACLNERCTFFFGGERRYPAGKFAWPAKANMQLDRSSVIFFKSALLELLACVLREGEQAGKAVGRFPPALQRALECISLRYGDPALDLNDLAGQAGLQQDHFGRVFRRHLGTTPMRYLQDVRIEKSCFLLTHTRLTVQEIAFEVGFNDPYYFSRLFHRRVGETPSMHRRGKQQTVNGGAKSWGEAGGGIS